MIKKTIAIIGAGPGVGLAIAQRFGKEGFNVALLGRNKQKAEKLIGQLDAAGISAAYFKADVMDRNELEQALQQVIAQFGSIDVLEYGPTPDEQSIRTIEAMDIEAANYGFEFVVLGAITAVNTVLPGMKASKNGAILFTTSISAQHPLNVTASFALAAGAQLNYARLLHNNLKQENIYAGIVSIAAMVIPEGSKAEELAAVLPPGLPLISAEEVANQHWDLYKDRGQCEAFVGNVEKLLSIPGFQY